jgi:hypothetical protein
MEEVDNEKWKIFYIFVPYGIVFCIMFVGSAYARRAENHFGSGDYR